MSFEEEIKQIEKRLLSLSTEEGKNAVYKFVPHSKHVYGVRMPAINQIARDYKAHGIPLAKSLWKKGGYEERILAAKLLEKVPVNQAHEALQCVDQFRHDIDNWAVCDTLGMQSVRKALKKNPELVMEVARNYLEDPNFWTIRLGMVFMVYFARHGQYLDEIQRVVTRFSAHDEYYVRKAVVWLESNLAKHG